MDFTSDVLVAAASLLSVIMLTQFSQFTLRDVGLITIEAINRLTENVIPFSKLLFVLVVSRAMRFKLDNNLGLGDISYSLTNPLLYMKLILTLVLNLVAGAIVYLLTGVTGTADSIF